MFTSIRRFVAEEEAQTLVEYAILISLLALVVVVVLIVTGFRLEGNFSAVASNVNTPQPTPTPIPSGASSN